MASGGADYQPTRIVVKNVPDNVSRDKVEIYFQKHKNGGCGDVVFVTFWVGGHDPNSTRQAVVEFESSETVKSVLAKKHQVFGCELDIEPFADQVFGQCDVVLNKSMAGIQGLSSIVESMTNVVLEKVDTDFHIKGQWYQIEAAVGWFEMLSKPSGLVMNISPQQPASLSVPSQVSFQRLPADEFMFNYYKLCYPGEVKSFMKKYKVSLRYEDGKIVFYPAQKRVAIQGPDALRVFKQNFITFSKTVKTLKFDYSIFPLDNAERDESINAAMATGKVIVGCDQVHGTESQITFLGLNSEDIHEAIDIFQTECMPLKNTKLATFRIDGQNSFNVTVIHGDFQQQRGDAFLSEMNVHGDSRIPLKYLVTEEGIEVTKALMLRLIPTGETTFATGVLNEKIPCKWLQHFIVGQKQNGKTNLKIVLSTAIQAILRSGGTNAVLPMFKENRCNVSSTDYMGIVASGIRMVNYNFTKFTDIYIVHNNYKEAKSLVNYLTSAKMFNILETGSYGTASPTKDGNSSEEDVCSICLDELSGAISMRTLPCSHTFHQACIEKAFHVSMKCPLCMRFYGKAKGSQPRDGTMNTRVMKNQSLPGYKGCNTIEIRYYFPNGTQGPEHPSPGLSYQGTSRTAYLPDNQEGRELLLLLRKAFEARITFTVGQSVTTGRDNVVTWNDIHHKTSISGGPLSYGYPDPTYLRRLRTELAEKGITP